MRTAGKRRPGQTEQAAIMLPVPRELLFIVMGLWSLASPLAGETLRVGFQGLMAAVLESGRALLVLSAALLTETAVTVEC